MIFETKLDLDQRFDLISHSRSFPILFFSFFSFSHSHFLLVDPSLSILQVQ